MALESFLTLLQFVDGLFPTGAFAHSLGMETYVQAGLVRGATQVEELVRTYLEALAAPADAVALGCALRHGRAGALAKCLRLDQMVEAMKPAAEPREASRQMGRQTLRVALQLISNPILEAFNHQANHGSTSAHHCVVLGLVGAALDWQVEQAVAAYLYASTVAITATAVKLVPLGQLQGQQIVYHLMPVVSSLASAAAWKSEEEMESFAPGIEIAQMLHERLDGRLFRS